MLRADQLRTTAEWYLGSTPAISPYASPLYADLHGFPPTLIHAGSTEVLLDDSVRFADKLMAAHVDVELRVWPDMPHVFHGLAMFVPEAREAIAEVGRFLDKRMVRGG
jgi:acetyl esterase/lipase